MGESAGGGLTARMALYNKDKGDKIPVKGEVLIYPMLDYRTGGKDDIYNNEYAGVLAEAYLEPGVPHSYNVVGHDTPQGERFVLLRDNAVQKMFGK